MIIQQLSVFIENTAGRLEMVTETLTKNQVNIIALSLADTSEYGMLRMIVEDPELGKKVLKEAGFSAKLTEVICVHLPHKAGALHTLLGLLLKSQIQVEYMYAFANNDKASIVLKCSEPQKAAELIKGSDLSY